MVSIAFFSEQLGAEVEDCDEETFLLFAQDIPSQNLGFINSSASSLELTVAGKDLTIHQSPGILSSNRSGGTTGAVVWKVTPLFAEWVASPDNILAKAGAISRSSSVLELGCGISAIIGIALASRVSTYTLTDQAYVARLVDQNIQENWIHLDRKQQQRTRGRKPNKPAAGASAATSSTETASLRFAPLDWETDEVTASLAEPAQGKSFDVVIACDCIYNDSLLDPLVQTCVDACRLRLASLAATPSANSGNESAAPSVCVVAQQLRDPEIFEGWIKRFHRMFHVWRVPDDSLPRGLRSGSGFVVHIGLLRC